MEKKIGLALGSGGARGFAHIGVIKTLEDGGIPISMIGGSSIGAMIGGFYAAGLSVAEMESITKETDWKRIFSLVDPRIKQGLIKGAKVKSFIESHVGDKSIEDCRMPYAAVTTDLESGEMVVIKEGRLSQAIMASIAIPLVFRPVRIGKRLLADGVLSSPVPVRPVRAMGADIVIAVNLEKHYHDSGWKPGLYGIANNSLSIMRHHLAIADSASADIRLDVDNGKSNWYQFTGGQEKISAGTAAMEGALPQLRKLMKRG